MLIGGMLSLAAGSSGTFMIMAGLEKQNLKIQIFRAITLIVLSLFLIPIFGMKIVVILYIVFMLFVNGIQLIYILKHIKISPFSKKLILLFSLTFFGMYIAIVQDFKFETLDYFIIPVLVYLGFFGVMFKPFKRLIKELL
jgi:O-antigen/teichoic acid export membrane protein